MVDVFVYKVIEHKRCGYRNHYTYARIYAQPISNLGIYADQTYKIGALVSLEAGFRYNAHIGPTDHTNKKDTTILYPEWNFTINYKASDRLLFKINTSSKTQPIHQLQVSSYSITINRWMPSNYRFMPHSISFSTFFNSFIHQAKSNFFYLSPFSFI